MPRTLDSMVRNYEVAQSLRAGGKNVWKHKLFAHLTDEMSFEEKRDEFAESLKASSWFRAVAHSYDDELWMLWDEIKDAEDVEHFDSVLDAIYDLADEDRCWITLR